MSQYVKKDTELGYIEDNAEIEYTRFNNMRHAVLGYMLGDFDTNGNYFVSDEIVRELISIKKYYVDTINEIDICRSAIKLDKQITFFVDIQNDKATLSLAEKLNFGANHKLNSGVYSNINEYVLDELELTGPIDRNAIYSHWNIDTFQGETLDVFHMDPETLAKHFNVVNRYKYLLAANTVLLQKEEKLEEIEAKYSNRIMAILAKYPKLKDAVMQDVKLAMEEKKDFLRIDKPNFAKTLNEVIEDSIQEHLDLLSAKEQEKFAEEKHTAQVEINQERAVEVPVNTAPVVDAEATKTEAIELPSITTIEVPQETPTLDPVELAKGLIDQQRKTEENVQERAVETIKPKDENKAQEPKEITKRPKTSENERLIENLERETQIKKEDNVSPETRKKAGLPAGKDNKKGQQAQQEQGQQAQQEQGQEVKQEEKKADPAKASANKNDGKRVDANASAKKGTAAQRLAPGTQRPAPGTQRPATGTQRPATTNKVETDKGLVGQLTKGKGKNAADNPVYVPPVGVDTPPAQSAPKQPALQGQGRRLVPVTRHVKADETAQAAITRVQAATTRVQATTGVQAEQAEAEQSVPLQK